MRFLPFTLLALLTLGPSEASAWGHLNDGCDSRYGRIYCRPGGGPGAVFRSHIGPRYYHGRRYYDRRYYGRGYDGYPRRRGYYLEFR
jgi:hypothetical protein